MRTFYFSVGGISKLSISSSLRYSANDKQSLFELAPGQLDLSRNSLATLYAYCTRALVLLCTQSWCRRWLTQKLSVFLQKSIVLSGKRNENENEKNPLKVASRSDQSNQKSLTRGGTDSVRQDETKTLPGRSMNIITFDHEQRMWLVSYWMRPAVGLACLVESSRSP